MKSFILIRHGRTGKDKAAPNRKVTQIGLEELEDTADALNRITNQEISLIYSTPTVRALQTAIHLSNLTGISVSSHLIEFSIGDFEMFCEQFKDKVSKREEFVELYFEKEKSKQLPGYMLYVQQSLLNLESKLSITECKLPILIGHGGSYDILIRMLGSKNKVIKSTKSKFLEYGEIVQIKTD